MKRIMIFSTIFVFLLVLLGCKKGINERTDSLTRPFQTDTISKPSKADTVSFSNIHPLGRKTSSLNSSPSFSVIGKYEPPTNESNQIYSPEYDYPHELYKLLIPFGQVDL